MLSNSTTHSSENKVESNQSLSHTLTSHHPCLALPDDDMHQMIDRRLDEDRLHDKDKLDDEMDEDHMPSSEHLATALGMNAHRMQVMKASFFATDPEPEEYDYSMRSGGTAAPARQSVFDVQAKPSPIPKLEESMSDRGQFKFQIFLQIK